MSPPSGFEAKRAQRQAEARSIADPHERLSRCVDAARRTPSLPLELRTDDRAVPGCLAKLWFVPEFRDGLCWYRCDSDSMVVKGVAALLCEFFSGERPEAIVAFSGDPLGDSGIERHLSPNRRHGLGQLRGLIVAFARFQLEATP
ncbi:MAG: SufE family protein [Verrucomicrobia bacterium]|nr:SufE family protein [Verrucomicrobiota bacterium]MBI3867152.1 SufE family protein [Verrucomicrobiota bacterium]